MSFLKSFFGAAAANAMRDSKMEEQKRQKRATLYDELDGIEEDFSLFLEQCNVEGTYIKDVRLLDEGRSAVNAERRKLENYKNKIKEYLSLGGHATNIPHYEKIEEYLIRLKYIRSMGYLDEQDNWILMDLDMLHSLIPKDIEVKKMYHAALAEKEEQERREAMIQSIGFDVDSLSSAEFENVCQVLVEKMGFTTQTTKASGDGGIDLIAYNHQPLLSGKYIIQCKRYAGSVGEPIIRDLYGVVTSERANKGILMTTGHFTKSAVAFSEGKPIELIDGIKLKSLLSEYGICVEADSEDDISVEEVFEANIMIDHMYGTYMNTLQALSDTNDEMVRAEFINQLLEWTLSEFPDISDFKHKLVIFKEIKNQIIRYVENNRVEKSKYLAFIYQMIYVQISILEGNFKDAVAMFSDLMKNKELQFNTIEAIEPSNTKPLFDEHIAVFSCMYYTFYDMVQMAAILGDEQLLIDLMYGTDCYGYKVLSKTRIEGTIKHYQQQGEGRERYWIGELDAYENIESIYCLYFMSNYEPKMYFDYTYHGGYISDTSLDRHNISIKGDSLVVDGIGNIEKLQQKVKKYFA